MMKNYLILSLAVISLSFTNMGKTLAESVDLTFNSTQSPEGFKATNGTIRHDSGKLLFSFQNGGKLSSPDLRNSTREVYAPYLENRNTIFIIMENHSNATKLRLSFITENDKEYSIDKSKVFNIMADNRMHGYLINLSDLQKAKGKLTGFRLEPVGGKGWLSIDRISMEREEKIEPFAGKVIRCVSKNGMINITGCVNRNYTKKYRKFAVYETTMNIEDGCKLSAMHQLYESDITDTFRINTIPLLKSERRTRLNSQFLAVVMNNDSDYMKVSPRFYIENWRDFANNPYSFTLSKLTVNASRFGAKGDGFTNDTKAIEDAMDYVSEHGGGTVVLEGDSSRYGKRYIATNVLLKSNVEFRIEKGATLWQSENPEDYSYKPTYKHDAVIPGVRWTHNLLVSNLPLIQGYYVKNIRICGGGKIRCMDTESRGSNPNSPYNLCEDAIHVIPIGLYGCDNVELTDVEVVRSEGYNVAFYRCSNVYAAHVKIHDIASLLTSDGIHLALGTHDAKLEQNFINTNDDGIVFWTSYNDPTAILWYFNEPEKNNAIYNLTACHNFVRSSSGKAIAFILWGSDNPNQENSEARDINVYDNILDGYSSVGAWADNPYFGSKNFDNKEPDYSPLKDVRIVDNDYLSRLDLGSGKATNFITDCGIPSSNTFLNGDFSQNGANWSHAGTAGVENKAGYAENGGQLFEGLTLTPGKYKLNVTVNGTGSVFVRNAETGENITVMPFNISSNQQKVLPVIFQIEKAIVYQLGICGEKEASASIFHADIQNND